MKRIAAIISAAFVLLSLCACADDPREGTDGTLAIVETPGETESAAVTENSVQTEGSVSNEPDPDTVVPVSPLLWRVTDTNGHELYLFGTIHAGDERNDRVFERISPVLTNCDALAVEFDTVAYENDMAQMTRDVAQYVLIDGTTISDHMPDELYSRTADLLNRAKMYPELYKKYNLAWWAQLVDTAMLTLYSDLDTEKGMETFLIDFAYEKEMPV
ncbi:MAG: TraB/GumN family protein, partial [Clostridia bacterium]|nr:TraB/GumN family protein [Clostridia bacterium]